MSLLTQTPTVNGSLESLGVGRNHLRNPTLPEKMKIIDSWFKKIQVAAFKANNKVRKSVQQRKEKKDGGESDSSEEEEPETNQLRKYVELEQIAEFMVESAFVSDKDGAIKQIMKVLRLKSRAGTMNLAHFQKVFVRPIFRESLVESLRDIEEMAAIAE